MNRDIVLSPTTCHVRLSTDIRPNRSGAEEATHVPQSKRIKNWRKDVASFHQSRRNNRVCATWEAPECDSPRKPADSDAIALSAELSR
jgi:hypothetical protein